MKETGIIMSGSHPVDILEGRKTMTRRVIKPQPYVDTKYIKYDKELNVWWFSRIEYDQSAHGVKCPYGQVGDRTWVRESYRLAPEFVDDINRIWYKADGREPNLSGKWRSSIFMPRWASRIILEVTEIRVERLQEITTEDIKAEGINPLRTDFDQPITQYEEVDRNLFITLWDSLNAKRGYDWKSNPWVWVISFKRLGEQK